MLPKLKRVRNVLMNSRASDDLGWQVLSEFERAREQKPFVAGQPASNHDEAELPQPDLSLDPIQDYLVTTMANRKQASE